MQTAGPSGHSVLCGSSLALRAFDEAQTDEPPHERSEATLRALRKHPCAGEVVRCSRRVAKLQPNERKKT